MSLIDLYELVKKYPTYAELVKNYEYVDDTSKAGNLYEKMWSLIILLGIHKDFQPSIYTYHYGNINNKSTKPVKDIYRYMKNTKIFGSNGGGASDITLKSEDTWVFMSSKLFVDGSKKSISAYDIEKIMAVRNAHSEYETSKIYLCVKDKQTVDLTIDRCTGSNKHLEMAIAGIMDMNDLEYYYGELRQTIKNIPIEKINKKFGTDKDHLKLRFHQDLLSHQMMKQIDKKMKHLLLGAKARSGKTYCIGGLLLKFYKKNGRLNALVITPAPNETMTQFIDDLFNKYRDFNDINIVAIKKGSDLDNLNLEENNIIVVSKQLLDGYVGENAILKIKNLHLDMIVFDENHFHGTTQMAVNMLSEYTMDNTIRVYLTATFGKTLNNWDIPPECQFYWDMISEHLCKHRNVTELIEQYGEDVKLFLNNKNKEECLRDYDNMPDLCIITNLMDLTRYEDIKRAVKDTDFGFSFSALFALHYDEKKDKYSFKYPDEVDKFLKYISGRSKDEIIRDIMSIFERIKMISGREMSRTNLNNGDFTTQLWFLPYGPEMPINAVSECLMDRMKKNSVLSTYSIMIVNSTKEYTDIKKEISEAEINAKKKGDQGLIILAGNQLTLGITLPYVDIVMLINDAKSSDRIVQMMYRCMTEALKKHNKINNGDKKMGFVVDLNVSRILNTLIEYYNKKNLNATDAIKYIIETNLIYFDPDIFYTKILKGDLINKLTDIWKTNPVNKLKSLLHKLKNMMIAIESDDQIKLDKLFTALNKNGAHGTFTFDESILPALPTGTKGKKPKKSATTQHISFTLDVLVLIIPLCCILTIKNANTDFIEIIQIIKNDPKLLEIFDDQSLIWWKQKGVIEIIEAIVAKYVTKDSSIYDITIKIKTSLRDLIDYPKELLELIDDCLKPKQKEKEDNGEVFTPMNIVFEMLETLDEYYIKEKGKSIFSEKDYKWGDILGCGMGNFSVGIYLKLMEGLKAEIPDALTRKKHILKNMIYMAEINKKNIFICKQIFDVNHEGINMFEGDMLSAKLPLFDVIVGNPPYNKNGIRSAKKKDENVNQEKASTLWIDFIKKAMDLLKPKGYLACMHPNTWLKKSHVLHDVLLTKHIMWMKLWDNASSKKLTHGETPIVQYVLCNENKQANTLVISQNTRGRLNKIETTYLDPKFNIPSAYFSIFNKLRTFIDNNNLQIKVYTNTVGNTGEEIRLFKDHTHTGELKKITADDNWSIYTENNTEVKLRKTIKPHPNAKLPKIIFAYKSRCKPFLDKGVLGITGGDNAYIIGDNLETLIKVFRFKICLIICDFMKYRQDFVSRESYEYIPDIRKLGNITELELYDMIGFTPDEIKQILSTI
jgi:hypothetical protein